MPACQRRINLIAYLKTDAVPLAIRENVTSTKLQNIHLTHSRNTLTPWGLNLYHPTASVLRFNDAARSHAIQMSYYVRNRARLQVCHHLWMDHPPLEIIDQTRPQSSCGHHPALPPTERHGDRHWCAWRTVYPATQSSNPVRSRYCGGTEQLCQVCPSDRDLASRPEECHDHRRGRRFRT